MILMEETICKFCQSEEETSEHFLINGIENPQGWKLHSRKSQLDFADLQKDKDKARPLRFKGDHNRSLKIAIVQGIQTAHYKLIYQLFLKKS